VRGGVLRRGRRALPLRCNVGIVVAKMLLMPTFAAGLMLLINATIGDEGSRLLPIDDPYDQVTRDLT
jgi:hypothetical protein